METSVCVVSEYGEGFVWEPGTLGLPTGGHWFFRWSQNEGNGLNHSPSFGPPTHETQHTQSHTHTRTSPTPVRPSSSVLSAYTQQNTAERSAGSLYMETPPRVSRQYLPTSRLLRDERDLPREISIMPSPSRCCAPHPQPARPLSTLHAPHSLASAQSRAPLRP